MSTLADHYGRCRLEECLCLKAIEEGRGYSWPGRACPDWMPTAAQSWDELVAEHAR
jgi:hypothetical protein